MAVNTTAASDGETLEELLSPGNWVAARRFSKPARLPLANPPEQPGNFVLYVNIPFFGPVIRYAAYTQNLKQALNQLRYALSSDDNERTAFDKIKTEVHGDLFSISYAYREEASPRRRKATQQDIISIYGHQLCQRRPNLIFAWLSDHMNRHSKDKLPVFLQKMMA